MPKPVIYLAGPVAHAADGGSGWREYVIREFGGQFDFRNPLSKYDVPTDDLAIVPGASDPTDDTTVGVTEIVEEDKRLLDAADAVLVGWEDVQSIGTPMEVLRAHRDGQPVALWNRYEAPLSPWFRYHADHISVDLHTCLNALHEEVTARVADD